MVARPRRHSFRRVTNAFLSRAHRENKQGGRLRWSDLFVRNFGSPSWADLWRIVDGRNLKSQLSMVATVCVVFLSATSASFGEEQGANVIMISEVYTNFDGTLQFIEVQSRGSFAGFDLDQVRLEALNADGTITTLVYDFTAPMPSLAAMQTLLLATQGIADSLGFAPDFLIPNGSISVDAGRIVYRYDAGSIIDAVAYGDYTGSNSGFGTPAPSMPCDGATSLTRTTFDLSIHENLTDYEALTNTPKRNDGTAGELSLNFDPPPAWQPISDRAVDEGHILAFNVEALDCDGAIPSLLVENLPLNATFVDSLNGRGRFRFAPDYSQSSVYSVNFVASDGNTADTEAVTITVNEIDNAPLASDTVFTILEDAVLVDSLPASDPDSDPLSYSILLGPAHGDITSFNASTGTFEYHPDANHNGVDSILFRVHDGILPSNDARVGITITSVNDPPVAGDLSASVSQNVPYGWGPMPVSDVDHSIWFVSHISGPFHGSVSNLNPITGSFIYSPLAGYIGPDSIKYLANDGADPSNIGTLRISVVAGCACPFQCDFDGDGFLTALDLGLLIDILFAGAPDITDGSCPHPRGDFDCDSFTTTLDLSGLIDYLFAGGGAPCNPCTP